MKKARMRVSLFAVLLCAIVIAVTSPDAVAADESTATSFSGYEIFLGISFGDNTYGTTFAGWTHEESLTDWIDSPDANGGKWLATVNYSGLAALGSSVEVSNGVWYWKASNGSHRWGRVLEGTVTWPASLNSDIGCGAGVGQFAASVGAGLSSTPAGSISACLDDMRPHEVFPPRVWGSLDISLPSSE